MSTYASRTVRAVPRLPLKGSLDLTYRCNCNCRHCWLRLPAGAPPRPAELSLEEIRTIADEARALGCREWALSGGEPLLRPDFPEIFDYLTRNSRRYSLNTNGSLITPQLARLLRRPGVKMVALYGATAAVHDRVTRTAGAFELVRRGFAYLREAGAGFVVQLVPLRANYHQWEAMVALAKSLSPHWRLGAAWLHLAADGPPRRNAAIAAQRLAPKEIIALDQPDPGFEERLAETGSCRQAPAAGPGEEVDDLLFARCLSQRRDFHIDPYGRLSFCSLIKDPALRYDLRRGSFAAGWDELLPALGREVRGGAEYRTNCGVCARRTDCRWCAAYAYLETGRYGAPIPYLCEVAGEAHRFKLAWQENHRRYFRIAGIMVRLESSLDLTALRFKPALARFAVSGPGEDNVTLRHYFELPDLKGHDLGQELYRRAPWAISRRNGTWYYLGISPAPADPQLHRVVVFNAGHTRGTIYSPPADEQRLRTMGFQSLSLFATDQVWLAPLLADRQAVLLHSAAVILNGRGLIFVGHSEAGKSTTVKMLREFAGLPENSATTVEVLGDDRNIVRRWERGWRLYGTWSHGEVPEVSPSAAPLGAVLFLNQAPSNEIVPLTDRK